MKLVDPRDTDIQKVMGAAADELALLPPIPTNAKGRARMLAIVEYQHAVLCPSRRFVFTVEPVPGTVWANISAYEFEPKDVN